MTYTVKKLSELSQVTVRTLHFYEEIGLLKPAYVGANGYRYYEEKELLQLQQILFFKELGFSLKQIKKVLGRNDFDKLSALHSHRRTLNQEIERISQLIKTIDKTVNHLQGDKRIEDTEVFDGFNLIRRSDESESYYVAEAIVLASVKNLSLEKREKQDYENIIKKAHKIFREIVECMENGCQPSSKKIQSIIEQHHAFTKEFHDATKSVYKALAKLYLEHPAFRKQLDPFHPKFAEFLSEAMEVYADLNL